LNDSFGQQIDFEMVERLMQNEEVHCWAAGLPKQFLKRVADGEHGVLDLMKVR
jgi:hypothetical protein